jgi:hypothetical protein
VIFPKISQIYGRKKKSQCHFEKKTTKKIPLKKKTISQMNSPLNNLKLHSILNFKWQKMELSKFFTNLKLHSILDIGEKG